MEFNIKSKKGFTLIELLVVIGILAVLAAIAIPSVAGLIDRANVSADNTNANEMTNALERFASEYELYIQDIGSGALDPNDLDSAQGRVYNVTGATTRGDITAIEKAQSVKVADVGDEVAIYRDTKYPVNNATLQKIVENYMKTSSSTFEPKQSDCNYYYSPDCGLVVCTETDKASTTDLNALVVSNKDAKGKELGPDTQWINVTKNSYKTLIHAGKLPENATYYDYSENKTLKVGDTFPIPDTRDEYRYEDYVYTFNKTCVVTGETSVEQQWTYDETQDGWHVKVTDTNKAEYGNVLHSIGGKNITNAYSTFAYCEELVVSPQLPQTITILSTTYYGCEKLTTCINISNFKNITAMNSTFFGCKSLKTYFGAPSNNNGDFSKMVIPSTVRSMRSAFLNCSSLTKSPIIPESVYNVHCTFSDCTNLEKVIINANPTYCNFFISISSQGKDLIIDGSSNMLQELANTSSSSYRNVFDKNGNLLK